MLREEAYSAVQRNAMATWEDRRPLIEHLLEDPAVTTQMTLTELHALLDPMPYLKYVDEIYRQCGLIE